MKKKNNILFIFLSIFTLSFQLSAETWHHSDGIGVRTGSSRRIGDTYYHSDGSSSSCAGG